MHSVSMNIAAMFIGVCVAMCVCVGVCGLVLMVGLRPISFYLTIAAEVVEQ